MKFIYQIILYLFFLFTWKPVPAQLPDGTVAPDFEVTDINGITHHLYDYLDEGKSVLLEIGATWCSPCWAYAKLETLNEAHHILGENGLDQVVILFIEGEPSNSVDQLYGVVGNTGDAYADFTPGNWTEIIDYPIIDNAAIADSYKITYYPTIYKICPTDKTIHQLGQLSLNNLIDSALQKACIHPNSSPDLGLLQYAGTTSVCEDYTINLPIEIINLGPPFNSDILLMAENAQGILVTEEVSVSLDCFERKTINLGPLTIEEESNFTFYLQSDIDTNPHNNYLSKTLGFAENTSSQTVHLELTTDSYGFETYWQIQGLDGTVYYSGGNQAVGITNGGNTYVNIQNGEGVYSNFEYINLELNLPPNCYELVFVDDYGDGICCAYGEGSYRLSDEQGQTLAEGGRFSDYAFHPFSIRSEVTSTRSLAHSIQIKCYPNPTNHQLFIETNSPLDTPMQLDFFNTIGEKISSHRISSTLSEIELNTFAKGLYFLQFRDVNNTLHTDKITIY